MGGGNPSGPDSLATDLQRDSSSPPLPFCAPGPPLTCSLFSRPEIGPHPLRGRPIMPRAARCLPPRAVAQSAPADQLPEGNKRSRRLHPAPHSAGRAAEGPRLAPLGASLSFPPPQKKTTSPGTRPRVGAGTWQIRVGEIILFPSSHPTGKKEGGGKRILSRGPRLPAV
jgi:hypothetical protein